MDSFDTHSPLPKNLYLQGGWLHCDSGGIPTQPAGTAELLPWTPVLDVSFLSVKWPYFFSFKKRGLP